MVRLPLAWLVRASTWPRFTLLGQAFGAFAVMWAAMRRVVPRVLVDTGAPEHAFGYPVANFAGAWPVCYTHYPFVSTDMISRVRDRAEMYNNQGQVRPAAGPAGALPRRPQTRDERGRGRGRRSPPLWWPVGSPGRCLS